MAEVGRPPFLRLRHQGMEVLDHGLQVEALELLGVVEHLAHWIGQSGVPMETLEVQLVRPPVTVRLVHDRALARALVGLRVHVSLQACAAFSRSVYKDHRFVESDPAHSPPNKASWPAQQKSGSRAISGSRRCIAQSDVGIDEGTSSPPGPSAGTPRRSTGCGINPQASGVCRATTVSRQNKVAGHWAALIPSVCAIAASCSRISLMPAANSCGPRKSMIWPVTASRVAMVGSASTTARTSAAMLSRSAIDIPRGPYMPIKPSSPRYG